MNIKFLIEKSFSAKLLQPKPPQSKPNTVVCIKTKPCDVYNVRLNIYFRKKKKKKRKIREKFLNSLKFIKNKKENYFLIKQTE